MRLVLNLSAPDGDDPAAFRDADYTWEGQRSIDGRLTSLFGLEDGRTVAVAATDDLLTQFVTPLAGGAVDLTVTLSDHGARTRARSRRPRTRLRRPQHPGLAAAFGV